MFINKKEYYIPPAAAACYDNIIRAYFPLSAEHTVDLDPLVALQNRGLGGVAFLKISTRRRRSAVKDMRPEIERQTNVLK